MPFPENAVTLIAALTMWSWCATTLYAMRTVRVLSVTAINRANPCDLAAVLGALPGAIGGLSRFRMVMRGAA